MMLFQVDMLFVEDMAESVMIPMIHGGSQERGYRGGTENIYGIVGLAAAMDLAYSDLAEHQQHVQGLKDYMIQELKKH